MTTQSPEEQCKQIHWLISPLPRFTKSKNGFPKDGLYIFFESGETTEHGSSVCDRIVRVGSHSSLHGLPDRLRKHYTGSKRNSAYIKLVGGALLMRDHPKSQCVISDGEYGHWQQQTGKCCPKCRPYNSKAKNYIKTSTNYTVIAVADPKMRDTMEKGLTATISLCSQCSPSSHWLGQYSPLGKVREGGLWQLDYVFDKNLVLSEESLDIFRGLVLDTKLKAQQNGLSISTGEHE